MATAKKAFDPERFDDVEVIADTRTGKPESVVLPMPVWERIPASRRNAIGSVVISMKGEEPTNVFVPFEVYRTILEDVEDALDLLLAEEADDAVAREDAALGRLRKKGIKVEKGVPLEVIRAEREGVHPIAAWRRYRNLTQADLAGKSGVERTYIAHLEGRKRGGAPETLARLARALGCLVEDLLPRRT